jgi:O-antigen/teichoic acid export membrane protein
MSNELGSKVRKSILALQGRQVVLLALNLGVGIILARKLGPEVFGIYGIATFCLSIITMATDFGLAGSLVQRKETFGEHEISVAFTLQTGVSLLAASILWIGAPLALLIYKHAPQELVWIIRSLALPVLFSPIGTIARLQLEREIQFHKIATIEIVSTLAGSIMVLALVFLDFGVWSFVWSTLTGAVTNSIMSWSMIRYRPRFSIDLKLTKELFSFGMFFQFGNITNEAAGWIIPLISGASLGPAAVGLLTWASSNGRRPLMVVDNVMRVAFPHFSRLQEHPHELAKQVGLYFRRLLLICYAWALLGLLLAAPMTHLVYTDKWMPGVSSLKLFALGLVFDVANWVGGMTLTAIGGVKETAKWTLVKSVLAISGAFLAVHPLGLIGIPLASIFASTISGTGLVIQLRKRIPMDLSELWKPAVPYIFAAVVYLPFLLWGGIAQSVAAWAIGIAAIAWTVRKALREFRGDKLLASAT